MIKGVIFDWNGTLSNDIPKVFAVSMKTVKKLGGRPLNSMKKFRRVVDNPYMLFYRRLGCSQPIGEVNRWYRHYLKREKMLVRLAPGAAALLGFLKMRGIKVGVVSSHPTPAIMAEAKSYRVEKFLDFVKGDLHTKSRHIREFLRKYRLRPEEVIFVGDMVNDVVEGKRCGVLTAAYTKGANTRRKLLHAKPDIVLAAISSLKRYL